MIIKKLMVITVLLVFQLTAQVKYDSTQVAQKLSIDVKDTDIRDVIRMISKGYNLNILLDQGITGKVTLHLSDVPIMEGLRSIAESNSLEVLKDGSVYKIQKATEEQKSSIRYYDNKLTLDVQNVNVRDFLKELSTKTAISIVPDAKVDGKISGKLFEIPFDDGIRALLEGNGYRVVKRKNIYQVSPSETAENNNFGNMRNNNPMGGMPGGKSNFSVEYENGKVSIDVTNGDLEDIVKSIAEQSDIEIITYGSIKSEINAKLNKEPLTEALALLLGGTRFTFVQKDNVILIGDRNSGTPSGDALSKSELIHLNHLKADNVPSILPKDIPANNVRVIKEQNALLISGTSEDIVSAREFLKTIDIPTPQVRIDAVIVEFKDNFKRETGIKLGRDRRLQNSSYSMTPVTDSKYTKEQSGTEVGVSGEWLKKTIDQTISALTNKDNNWGLLGHLPDDFFAIIRVLETQDKAKVLAQPSILTLNGNKASIDVSETQYYKIATGVAENYTTRFQPIKFGIQLDITPWISQGGQITAEITPNVSNSEGTNAEQYPNISNRSITTTVRLNDGETLVLGGLIKNQETETHDKVPILGDLPIIGALFRHTSKTKSRSNLVVYITPHVINDGGSVDVQKEIEKYELLNKSPLEQQVYKGVKKIESVFTGKKTASTDSIKKDTVSVRDSLQIKPAKESSDKPGINNIKNSQNSVVAPSITDGVRESNKK